MTELTDKYQAWKAERKRLQQEARVWVEQELARTGFTSAVTNAIHEARKTEKIDGVLAQLGTKNKSLLYMFINAGPATAQAPYKVEGAPQTAYQAAEYEVRANTDPNDDSEFDVLIDGKLVAELTLNSEGVVQGIPQSWYGAPAEQAALYRQIIAEVQNNG